jgi:tetratricopeptide (TPR) repeat protein
VAADPGFVLAWCFLAQVHGTIYFWGHDHTPARLDFANAAVQTALRLQPEAGEPHLALATYYYRAFRDYERARRELAIARKTLPNNAEVFFYMGTVDYRSAQWEEATRNLERAVELDPRNVMTVQQLALCYQPQRRYVDEARMWERSLTILPRDPNSRICRAQVEANWKADMKPFQTTLAALIVENPSVAADNDDPLYGLRERTPAAAARVLRDYPRDGAGPTASIIPRPTGRAWLPVGREMPPKRELLLPPRAPRWKRSWKSSPTSRRLSAFWG